MLPFSLQLPQHAPDGVSGYRRRFISPVTNVQEAGPDEFVQIYPDTSTPGSFIDPESTYLMFDLNLYNGNPYVDYANFCECGPGASIIQDWRVYNQGTITEEILEYPTVCNALTTLSGQYSQEVSFYFSNQLKLGVYADYHRNFIKPAMADASGNIMYGPNPYGLTYDNSYYTSNTYCNSAAGGDTSGFTYCMASPSGPNFSFVKQIANGFTLNQTNYIGRPPYVNTMQVQTNPSNGNTGSLQSMITPMDWPDLYVPNTLTELRDAYIKEYGSICKPQVMASLCNVKCFPIGVIPTSNCYSQVGSKYGDLAAQALGTSGVYSTTPSNVKGSAQAPTKVKVTYRICYQPISGIFGTMARKMLATTLLAPQQMYIQLHTASAPTVMQLCSDPCRRIAGTVRDYIRNTGTMNGQAYGDTTWTMTANPTSAEENGLYRYNTSTYAVGYSPWHSVPITVGTNDQWSTGVNTIFSKAAAAGQAMGQNVQVNAASTTAITGDTAVDFYPPTPQYQLVQNPWLYKPVTITAGAPAIVAANESQCFYGTYLPASVPQSTRIFALKPDGSSNGSNPVPPPASASTTNNEGTTYTISNISLVGDQLILPGPVTDDVVEQAGAAKFNVDTMSVRTYVLQVQPQSSQTIILPIRITDAKRLLIVWQDMDQRNANTAFYYDSNCGINPYAKVDKGDNNTIVNIPMNTTVSANPCGMTGVGTPTTLYGVGYTNPIQYIPTKVGTSDISLQLRIGNEYFPVTPYQTLNEMQVELTKTMEGWTNHGYTPNFQANVLPFVTSAATTPSMVYDCLKKNTYCTAFHPIDCCDDQTFTCNYDMAPLYAVHSTTAAAANDIGDSTIATRRSAYNGFNWMNPRGSMVTGCFVPPSSRFIMGFNLKTFKSTDGVSDGMFLGNNVITLLTTGAVGLTGTNRAYRAVAIVPHSVIFQYAPGGQVIWTY
jgi:hypothetical protein